MGRRDGLEPLGGDTVIPDELIEAAARAYWQDDGIGAENWNDELSYFARALSAAFEVREPCATCGGTALDREWRCGCGRGVRHFVDCGRPAPRVPCPDCLDHPGQGERVIDKWLRETRLEAVDVYPYVHRDGASTLYAWLSEREEP